MKRLKVMAWDTATPYCTAALLSFEDQGFEVLAEFQSESGVHSQVLPPQLELMLKENRLKAADLDLLVVGRGPGSFTGLRTGLALAKGLAMGAGLPLMGLPSPEPVAAALLLEGESGQADKILAAPLIDARHGEIFTALYQADPGGDFRLNCLMSPRPLAAAEIPARLLEAAAGRRIVLAGPALKLFLETCPSPLPDDLIIGSTELLPAASRLARLAVPIYLADEKAALEYPPLPLYLRQPDLRHSGIAMR